MILTDRRIADAQQNGEIRIDPFEERQLQGATYDVRVGDQGATTSSKSLINIKEKGFIQLQPGDFGVVTILETIKLDNQHVGRIGLRSKYARKGLIATTGPQIDPGYHGRLIVGLTNLTPTPVSLIYGDDLLSIEFHKLSEPSTKPYDGPYQGKTTLGAEEIAFITEREGMALSEVLTSLRSLSQNVGKLATEVKILYWAVPAIVGLGITVIGVIVAIK